ncbi:6-phospho-beta-glucosidase [Halanaerobium congolense]|jgi:6-phospho-beta-glucosidase|uniref:6-phospho-beta-glucosidase n=1 Tax=Halanaerobium congolense TaxID=54121 RepID=A0A4R7EF02_9FIRM|nr:6-phospho-beta-glucosidase [Halanaerobium congolense]TDS32280.1 6-phospho-beta-glucosidase [Halanaerobium congolense]
MATDRGIKVATIGGGSSYTPEIVEGFIKRYDEFPIKDLYLVDIEEGKWKLDIVGDLAKRMVAEAGVDINIHLTLDRREAIKDADFVTTQFRVGLLDARIRDEKIPLEYNCIGQETTGAGGMAKALRTIPVILDIAKDMEELAPDAWLINFTNPSGIITETVSKYTDIKAIGLCNVPIVMEKMAAEILDADQDQLRMDFVGLNHLVWGRAAYLNGENKITEVLDKLATGNFKDVENVPDYEWGKERLQSLGMLPCPYHRYYYLTDLMLQEEIEAAKTEGTRGEVVKELEASLFELYKNKDLKVKPKELEERGGQYYSDAACDLISAIYNDKGTLHYVNVKNDGAVNCLPDDSVIERTSYVGKNGASPLNVEPLPSQVKGLLQVVNEYEALTIEAGVHGDYNAAFQALTIHPLVESSIVKDLLDDIIEKNINYLPQFQK